MEVKILVYDSQIGYYEFLKHVFTRKFGILRLFKKEKTIEDDYRMMVFFLHTEMELLDFFRLYRKDIPVILASSVQGNNFQMKYTGNGNIYHLDLTSHKDKLQQEIQKLFSRLLPEMQ